SGSVAISVDQAVAFFQGKNLSISDTDDLSGEVILNYAGHGIGLAKAIGRGKLKNQLPRELVHDNAWA
ncbi:MAG: 16S rRNA (cytosine(1407)-C(5))-methyltransferase RsmF, partial [Enterobacterales bacterium]|nr:16S rRNA (cytosine(1407)-C(5))-methyltransferase RsmF [Enterobacterales bacterium]